MNERLRQIINYKTKGKQKQFAELVGWSPAYLNKLLQGVDFGLKPVVTILEKLPEINARWFLLGQGEMLMDDAVSDLRRGAFNHIQAILDLERFVKVMTPEELLEYEKMITSHKTPIFSQSVRATWIEKLHEKEQDVRIHFDDAIKLSEELCKQKTAKE